MKQLYYPIRLHASLLLVTLLSTYCHSDSINSKPIHVPNINEPVLESGFRPIDNGRDKEVVRKRGLVIDERISLSQVKRADGEHNIEAEILGSSENENKSVERVSKDLRNFPPYQRSSEFTNRCDNCNAFPWIPIARAIRLPPPSNINTPSGYPPPPPQGGYPPHNQGGFPPLSHNEDGSQGRFPPMPPPPNFINSEPHPGGDNIPAASVQNSPPPPPPPQDQQPIRVPSSLNIPNPEFHYNRNIPIPSGPSQNFLTYPNGGPGFKKEQPMQVTLVNRPERPAGMLQSILNFFSPRPKQPPKPPIKNVRPPMPIGLKQPSNEPFPSASSDFEYEKPPPFPNPPYIPLNNDFRGLPPSMSLPPNKIFIYNIAADQNAKANQELPIYNANPRKPEVNTIRPMQQFANFRYAPMAIFPQPIPMHLMQPFNRFNGPQKIVPGIIPGAIRLPANVASIETVKSRPVASYLASIEYPQEIIQSPLIDVSTNYSHEPKLDSTNYLSTPRPIFVPETVDNSLTGGLQTATVPTSSEATYEPSSTPYPDLNPSAGNIITNLTGSPFRTTTDGYTGLDLVQSQSYADFDWPVTQTSMLSSEDTTLTDYPTTYQPEVSSLKPTQFFNVSQVEEGRAQERPSDPAFNYLSPPPVSADWSQDLWSSRPALGSGFQSTPGSGFQSTLGSGFQSTPESGFQSIPGSGFQSTPGSGFQSTPGSGFQSTPGSGFQSTPGSGFQSTPGSGFQSTPGSGFQSTPGSGFQSTAGSEFQTTVGPSPLKKKKQIQIIVPYMVSPLDAEGKAVTSVTSTENLITAINQLPETTLAERPFVTLDHLQQFLDENRAKGNGIDLFRLQKNIDNWTAQGFSNHKHGQTLGIGQEDHIAQIHPAKNIPENFLTGSEVFPNSFVSTYNSRDNEKRHIYSERRSVGLGNPHPHNHLSPDAAGAESSLRASKVIAEGKRTSSTTPVTTSTSALTSTERTDAGGSGVWDSIPVAISPLTKEKVYMVTAVPHVDRPANQQARSFAQQS